jgi:phage terminase large subunit
MIELNEKYQDLFKADSRYFILRGGRGSAKSFGATTFLSMLMLERGHKILFTRYTMTSAQHSIIPEFTEKISLLGLDEHFTITKDSIVCNLSGSEIIFKGIKTSSGNQTAALKSLQGITTWVLDEAEELTDEETFDKIDLSIRQKGMQNRVILILNPTTKAHWIYQKFFESRGIQDNFHGTENGVTYIFTSYLDNIQHLDESFIQSAEDMKARRPEKYKHIMLGGWLNKAEGVIFQDWSIGEMDRSLPVIFGQDYGFSIDPTTLVETRIDKSKKLIYLKEHIYTPKLTTSVIGDLNAKFSGGELIVGDSAEPRLIAELKSKGNNIVPAIKGAGSITAGIALMQDYDLIIDKDSHGLIKELNNYVWSVKGSVPVDAYNHAIDAARYAVYYDLGKPNRGKYVVR